MFRFVDWNNSASFLGYRFSPGIRYITINNKSEKEPNFVSDFAETLLFYKKFNELYAQWFQSIENVWETFWVLDVKLSLNKLAFLSKS